MLTAIYFGLIASSALIVGGFIGARWRPPRKVTGILLAFASGTLISALAFDLFPVAVEMGGLERATLGLLAGAATFVVINQWLDQRLAPSAASGEKAEHTDILKEGAIRERATRSVGFALLASVTLDGIPENLALGVSLQTQASLTLLVAIFTSNFPEALVGASAMRRGGQPRRQVVLIWTGAAFILTLMVVIGQIAGNLSRPWLALMMAFAGGAVLASLADTLMPEAFERGRPLNAFATVAGFVLSFALAEQH